jgi:hypothetical protein
MNFYMVGMGNQRSKYTDEEWEELELSIKANAEAKKQALKDIENEQRRNKKASTSRRRGRRAE